MELRVQNGPKKKKKKKKSKAEEEPLTYRSSTTELINNNLKDVTAFLDQFQTRVPIRFYDRDVLFALTLLDPRSLNHEGELVSIAKLPVLLAHNSTSKRLTPPYFRRVSSTLWSMHPVWLRASSVGRREGRLSLHGTSSSCQLGATKTACTTAFA